jgi:cytochrome c553
MIAGATIILAAACGGTPAPTNTPAPPTPTATGAAMPTTPPSGGNGGGDLVAKGKEIAATASPAPCTTCHSVDGTVIVGPSWKGVYGEQVTLTDGTTVTVDDAYIRESILDPNAKIVQGFQPNVMIQTYKDTLSDSDIEALIAYIKSLK